MTKLVGATFVLAGALACVLTASAADTTAVMQIVAHRGASAECPENTLASTRRAIEAGASAVEVDVRTTKDGALVLSHDAKVDRTTNGQGAINALTLAEIKRLDAGRWFHERFAGERMPTLGEALAVCKGRIDVLLDLKVDGVDYVQKVIADVRSHGEPRRTIVGVRSVEQAKQFRKLLPEARQIGLIAKPDEIEAYAAAGVEMIRLWPKWLSDSTLVGRVAQSGAKLHLNGTTGQPDEIAPLLKHRPFSLSSDDPARLKKTLAELAK